MYNPALSIYGLYVHDHSIFDGFNLPEDVDKELLINNLVVELGELEILYPEPAFIKKAIEVWSNKEINTWEKLVATTKYEYDPIANFDRKEDWTETRKGTNTDNTKTTTTDEFTGKVAAFNSNTLEPSTGSSGSSDGSVDKTLGIDETVTHSATLKGNIGVTTTQQMIEAERDVVKFNIYNYIIDAFKMRFCVLVY